MARLGAFCFPGTGHINPMTALARALQRRGHQVVYLRDRHASARVRAAGVEFYRIGAKDYPPGTLRKLDERLGELKGLATFNFTVERVKNTARMILRDGPEAVRNTRVEALLVDEADMGGNVAEYLGLPFVSIAMFPPLVQDDRIPPFCFGWTAGQDKISRLRNELGFRLLSKVAAPIFKVVNDQRRAWGLPPLKRSTDALSKLAQIAQLPAALEFDVPGRPAVLHYTGPFVDAHQRPVVDFPGQARWPSARLRVAGHAPEWFGVDLQDHCEACAGAPRAVGDLARRRSRPGSSGLSPWRSAGSALRSAVGNRQARRRRDHPRRPEYGLESLAEGVPLVALPLGNDQPGVAARVRAHGAAVVIPQQKLTAGKLRSAVQTVLENPTYRDSARKLQAAFQRVDGLSRAADIIEEAFGIGSAQRCGRTEFRAADSARTPALFLSTAFTLRAR